MPLIKLLQTIVMANFHFEATFEASEGAGRAIAAATRLLQRANSLSTAATKVFV